MDRITQQTGAFSAPVITLSDVGMAYGAVQALVGANLTLTTGECIGLVGHNGAGKSTLVNVINGRLTPTSGQIAYGSMTVSQIGKNSLQARAFGVRSVFQELSLFPNLTVVENMRVPRADLPVFGWQKQSRSAVITALDTVFPNHGINPADRVADLSIAQRQMVEIAIAFAERKIDAKLVILDEPTSSLDASIAKQLLNYIKTFCAQGGTIIFISHMLGEIFHVASRIIVMKDGRIVADHPTREFTRDSLVEEMGHVVSGGASSRAARKITNVEPEVLRLENGLNARKGEIIGLAGLAGHGQAEALAHFFMQKSSDWKASRAPALAFVAGDRARDGIMPLWSIVKNLSLQTLSEFSHGVLVNRTRENELAHDWRERIGIRTNNLFNPILSLSGGNQQKVLFAKALASTAPIVVMDDPMRGVDVGTKKEVYQMIRDEAEKGRTFLWYSTETDEILQCDRVFVFRDGAISAELSGDKISEENILRASFEMQEATA